MACRMDAASDEPAPPPALPPHDPYAAMRFRDYRYFLGGSVISNFGMQMQTVAVAWEIYKRTNSALALAFVGLAEFLPVIFLALFAGQIADLFERRRIIMVTQAVMACSSVGLAVVSLTGADVRLMYLLLILTGSARAFLQPAKASYLPLLVPRRHFSNAVTWNSGGFQTASVVGPAFGGLLLAHFQPPVVYGVDAICAMTFFTLLALMTGRRMSEDAEAAREKQACLECGYDLAGNVSGTCPECGWAIDWEALRSPAQARPADRAITLKSLGAGLAFLRRSPIVLGAITLDMFAVLLGGATMLLPIYARDILKVGEVGFGWMRAAPAVGALSMAFMLAYRPPAEKSGAKLLWAVVGFGVATIIFGLSRNFWLSLAMLFLTGAFDSISVVIRHTLVQLLTPDHMRGRVTAVNSLFIGASNELGGFESGFVADMAGRLAQAWFGATTGGWIAPLVLSPAFGPTFSVVLGGLGTIATVALVATRWPQLRRYGRLGSPA